MEASEKEALRVKATETANAPSFVDKIIAYENGEMSDEDTIELFQTLIDSGMAWTLQGHYGRTAMSLIEAGYCHK